MREPRSRDRGHLHGDHDDAERCEWHPDAEGIGLKEHVVHDERHHEDRRVEQQQSTDDRTARGDTDRGAQGLPVAERALSIVLESWRLLHGKHERRRDEAAQPADREAQRHIDRRDRRTDHRRDAL